MPRPALLNNEIQENVCKALKAGNTRHAAAAFGGISPRTFNYWMARARKAEEKLEAGVELAEDEEKFVDFSDAVHEAEGLAECQAVAIVNKHARENTAGQWTASAWWLERKKPDSWGRRERRDQQEALGEKIQINVMGPATVEKE